jgi:ubiquinone/menaquinone biosynthesis C-methylase UbiE
MYKQILKSIRQNVRDIRTRRRLAAINQILQDPTPPVTFESEAAFDRLQAHYPATRGDQYRYDDYSLFERASQRALKLLQLNGMADAGKQVLDIGAGDGVLGAMLQNYGHRVVLADMEDWRSRVGRTVDFCQADISTGLPFEDESFDLVVSYNSFEHFPDPQKALSEAVRVTKPNGQLFFEFGPLFCSPWGLHAYRSLYMPYPQFLFSEPFITEKLAKFGIRDLGKKRTELQFMNRWKWTEFNDLWKLSNCTVRLSDGYIDQGHLNLVVSYPEAFRGRGMTTDDITRSSLTVNLYKSV